MKPLLWFERKFTFGLPAGMLPFYLERLAGTEARLREKVKNCGEQTLSDRLEEKWSVKENIGHLAEVDEIASRRIDEIIAGAAQLSPAVFALKRDYNALPVADVLTCFHDARLRNLDRYKRLSASDMEKSSLHPRLKVSMTAVDLAWFDAEHDDHHSVRINEILRTLSSA